MIYNKLLSNSFNWSSRFPDCSALRLPFLACLMMVLALFPSLVKAQSTDVFVSHEILVGDNDVIRDWQYDISVAFIPSVNNGAGAFALIDKAGFTVTLAFVPSNVRVYDFRVVDDSVFFCGSVNLSAQDCLLLGSFDINEVFLFGGSISYGVMSTPWPTDYGWSLVKKAWRMETYRLGGTGRTHIVAVGASYMNGGQYDRTTMLDAYFDGTVWVMTYHEDKDGDEYFTDITCTDNYVVASAMHSHPDSNCCFIRVFDKTYPFTSYPVYPNQLIKIIRGLPTGKVLIESLGSDSIAIAYYESLTASAGSTIQLFDLSSAPAMPVLLHSIYIQQSNTPLVSSTWKLQDIKYNFSQHILTLLQILSYPLNPTTVCALSEFDISNISSLSYFASWVTNYRFFAIDKRIAGDYEAIGYNNYRELAVYDNIFSTASECNVTGKPTYIDDTPFVTTSTLYTHEKDYSLTLYSGTYYPSLNSEALDNICHEEHLNNN